MGGEGEEESWDEASGPIVGVFDFGHTGERVDFEKSKQRARRLCPLVLSMRSSKNLSHYLMPGASTCISCPFLLPAACFTASERDETEGGNALKRT